MRKIIRDKVLVLDGNNSKVVNKNEYNPKKIKRRKKRVSKSLRKKLKANNFRTLKKQKLLEKYAKELETYLPKSEIWFRDKYRNENIARTHKGKRFKDEYNKPYSATYIPDIINEGYKYIIEIDGSVHDRPDIQLNDLKKDHFFIKRGFLVIRIKAYDEESYKTGMDKLREYIAKFDAPEIEARAKRVAALKDKVKI